MKKNIVLIIGLTMSIISFGQIEGALKIVGNVISEASSSVKEAEKWEKLYKLITNSICMERNFKLYYKFYINNKDCFLNLDIERSLNDFDGILTVLNTAITARLTKKATKVISQKDENDTENKENNVDAILVQVEKTITEMEALNRKIFTGIQRMLDSRTFSAQNSGSGQEISQIMKKIF